MFLMALIKEIVIDKIEVLESNAIQVRQATRVLEDGVLLSQSYHRHVLSPGADLTNEDPKVVAVATAAWDTIPVPEPLVDNDTTPPVVEEDV
jgi:hypothetical protein